MPSAAEKRKTDPARRLQRTDVVKPDGLLLHLYKRTGEQGAEATRPE